MTEAVVDSVDGFDDTLQKISARAEVEGAAIQVDLQDVPLRPDGPILVGPGPRSSVLWHNDGISFAAAERGLLPLANDLVYTRGPERRCAPPEETRISQRAAIEALVVHLLTGERAESLEWMEASSD
ncbi:hypothetical protein [Pseudonocardia xishanensis]